MQLKFTFLQIEYRIPINLPHFKSTTTIMREHENHALDTTTQRTDYSTTTSISPYTEPPPYTWAQILAFLLSYLDLDAYILRYRIHRHAKRWEHITNPPIPAPQSNWHDLLLYLGLREDHTDACEQQVIDRRHYKRRQRYRAFEGRDDEFFDSPWPSPVLAAAEDEPLLPYHVPSIALGRDSDGALTASEYRGLVKETFLNWFWPKAYYWQDKWGGVKTWFSSAL